MTRKYIEDAGIWLNNGKVQVYLEDKFRDVEMDLAHRVIGFVGTTTGPRFRVERLTAWSFRGRFWFSLSIGFGKKARRITLG